MLKARFSPPASVETSGTGWRLLTPAGGQNSYLLAQLDDYTWLNRKNFPHSPPVHLSFICRASSPTLPGTWGFGLWNDPFAFSLGLQGMARRLPALPNACWFFYASPENHLSFHDDLPASGFLAQSFRSPLFPSGLLLPGLLATPMLSVRPLSKLLRKITGKIIAEDSQLLQVDPTARHAYSLSWHVNKVIFSIDGSVVFRTPLCPLGRLGLVIWIDNQYAAWTPQGKMSMGTLLQNSPSWLEIYQIEIKT